MKRYLIGVGAFVLLGVLVLVTVLMASTVDATALGRARAVASLPTASNGRPQATMPCTASAASGATKPAAPAGTPSLTLTGACTGRLTAGLACADNDDVLDGSLQSTLTDGLLLTLTVVLADYSGPGEYDEAAVYVQVGRSGEAARWSVREAEAKVDPSGRIAVSATLSAEPGTHTAGVLGLHGALHCLNGG